MEFLHLLHTNAAMPTILALVVVYVCVLSFITRNGKRNAAKSVVALAPEASGALPIIGHLHLLGGRQILHRTLGTMADKFGPIFSIKLGMHPAIVVSNWEMAKQCFTTNDAIFSNRPKSLAVEILGYNYANFGFGTYGAYWRHLRKLTVFELLSNSRLELIGRIRQEEVKASIRAIYELWVQNKSASGTDQALVEMKRWFWELTINIMQKIVIGKRYSSEEQEDSIRFQRCMRQVFEYFGIFLVSDALPFLRWLDLGGYEKAMKRTAKDLDNILQNWLDEHKQKRIPDMKGEQDVMDVMLSVLTDEPATKDHPFWDADTINKSNCLGVLLGGTDTTTVTLTWALSLLLNHPHAMKKAREELELHIGSGRQVELSDTKNLVYIQAIIKETFRLYPAGPLIGPRESIEDCTLAGYFIPKGTRLVVNAAKIQRDPRAWPEPDEFRPERFLTTHKDIDLKGQNFELIPFGSGRRMCVGASLALQILHLTLASLLHGFDIATVSNESVDMTESSGLSNLKATPLEVLVTPRLSPSLYE